MKKKTGNLFALLEDGEIRIINLTQEITGDIREVFFKYGNELLNDDKEQVSFTGNYVVEDDEVLYVEMILPPAVTAAAANALGTPDLDMTEDKIKALFWQEDQVYYFQNFDSRRLLGSRNVIFYREGTYSRLTENAFIVENIVNAVYKDGRFFFTSYANANKIFSLSDFYHAATNEEIGIFAVSGKVSVDTEWFTTKTNSTIRKQITLLLKSKILDTADTESIRFSAKDFKLDIDLDDGRIVFPNNQRKCKDILIFLNEQYYTGLITGTKYRTNSKRKA
jgi:predicted transcriptional regulator